MNGGHTSKLESLLYISEELIMRVLITGGAGFIGSHLAERLLLRGDWVTIIDDLSTGSIDNLQFAHF